MRLPPSPTRPELDALLKASAKHKMTPGEIWDQRVSFAYGNLPEENHTTKKQVKVLARMMYGPRPEK